MQKAVVGYVGTIAGVLIAMLTLASLGDASPNYLVTAVLALLTVVSLGVGWYGLRVEGEVA